MDDSAAAASGLGVMTLIAQIESFVGQQLSLDDVLAQYDRQRVSLLAADDDVAAWLCEQVDFWREHYSGSATVEARMRAALVGVLDIYRACWR